MVDSSSSTFIFCKRIFIYVFMKHKKKEIKLHENLQKKLWYKTFLSFDITFDKKVSFRINARDTYAKKTHKPKYKLVVIKWGKEELHYGKTLNLICKIYNFLLMDQGGLNCSVWTLFSRLQGCSSRHFPFICPRDWG